MRAKGEMIMYVLVGVVVFWGTVRLGWLFGYPVMGAVAAFGLVVLSWAALNWYEGEE